MLRAFEGWPAFVEGFHHRGIADSGIMSEDALALQQLEVLEGLLDRGDPIRVEVPQVGQGEVDQRGRADRGPRRHADGDPRRVVVGTRGILDQLLEEILGAGTVRTSKSFSLASPAT